MTIKECPASNKRRKARINLAMSSKCKPVVGSSNKNSMPLRAKVCLLSKDALKTALQNRSDSKTKPAQAPIGVYVRSFTPKDESALAVRQMPMDAERAAHELFAVLRDLDAHNVSEIWVESVPQEPLWAGVADRLQRASA
jgi:L-threonylcarbamoyladenylate synthase